MPGGEIEINGRRSNGAMPEKHLNGAQVVTGIQAMGSKTMPEGVGSDLLIRREHLCSGRANRLLNVLLGHGNIPVFSGK